MPTDVVPVHRETVTEKQKAVIELPHSIYSAPRIHPSSFILPPSSLNSSMNIPLDKSYIKPTRVDETGKIVNWDPERQAECLEYALPKYILPKPVGAADVGLKWLWPGRIPQGRVTVVEGAPAVGKTYLASFLASIVTRGQAWPEQPGQRKPVGNVLYFCRKRDMQDCRDKEDKLKKDPRPWDEAAPYVWCLSRDPVDLDLCRFEPKRTTFCREPEGLAFRIQDDGTLAFEPLVHRKSMSTP